jgi:uncharacterized glyoxalase superfamily protein PhnB
MRDNFPNAFIIRVVMIKCPVAASFSQCLPAMEQACMQVLTLQSIKNNMIRLAIPVLHISDHVLAESFYCNHLGFTKTFSYCPFGETGPHYLGISRDGIEVHLSSFPGDGVAGNAVVLIVDNVDTLYNEFVSKKVNIDLPPTDQSWGNREMYINDSDNNSIRFTQWKE